MGFFKANPVAKLEKEYARKLEQARNAQRNGNLQDFADLSAEAEALGQKLDALKQDESSTRANGQ